MANNNQNNNQSTDPNNDQELNPYTNQTYVPPKTDPPADQEDKSTPSSSIKEWQNTFGKMSFKQMREFNKKFAQENADVLREERSMAADKTLSSKLDNLSLQGIKPLMKYDKNLLVGLDQNDVRAYHQSDLRAIGLATVNMIPEFLGDVITFTGTLGEIPEMITKGYADFDNALMRAGEAIRETKFGEIYASRSAQQGFRPFDGEWWALNMGTIISSVSMAVPGVGAIKALGMLGKLARYGKLASKGLRLTQNTRKLGKGLLNSGYLERGATALVSRHMEMSVEAKETFDEIYQLGIERGLDKETARAKAGEAAMAHYGAGYIAMVTDLPQYMVGLRGKSLKKVGKVLEGGKKTRFGAVKNFIRRNGSTIGDIVAEGGEEAFQYILGEEARRYGYDPDNYRIGDMPLSKYMEDPQLWTSAFFGALGGALFNIGIGGVKNQVDKFGNFISNVMSKKDPQKESVKNIIKESVLTEDQDDIISTFEALEEDSQLMLPPGQSKELVNTSQELVAIRDGLNASRDSNNDSPNTPNRRKVNYLRGVRGYLNSKIKSAQEAISNLVNEVSNNSDISSYNVAKTKLRRLKARLAEVYNTEYDRKAIEKLMAKEQEILNKYESQEGFNRNDYTIDKSNAKWDEAFSEIDDLLDNQIEVERSFLQEQDLKNGTITDEYVKDIKDEFSEKANNTNSYGGFQLLLDEIDQELEETFSNNPEQDQKARDTYLNLRNQIVAQRDAKIAEAIENVNMNDYADKSFGDYMNDILEDPFIKTLSNDAKSKLEGSLAEKWNKLNPDNKAPNKNLYKYNVGKGFVTPQGVSMITAIDPDNETYITTDLTTGQETVYDRSELEAIINESEKDSDPYTNPDVETATDTVGISANDDLSQPELNTNSKSLPNEPAVEDPSEAGDDYINWTDSEIENKRSAIEKELEALRKKIQDLKNQNKSASYNDFYISITDLISRHFDLYEKNPLFRMAIREYINTYDGTKSFAELQKEIKNKLNIDLKLSDIQNYHDSVIGDGMATIYDFKKRRHLKNAKLKYDTEYNIKQLEEIFKHLDSTPEVKSLFEKLKGNIEKFGISIVFPSKETNLFGSESKGLGGLYDHANKKIYINIEALLQSGDVSKAIAHEMIHGTLDYMIHLSENDPDALTQDQKDILFDLELIRLTLKEVPGFATEYALTSTSELLAAMSDKRFVDKLKKAKLSGKPNFLKQIIDFVLRLLGVPTSYYHLVEEGFGLLSDSASVEAYNSSIEIANNIEEESEEDDDTSEGALTNEKEIDEELEDAWQDSLEESFDDDVSEENQLAEREAYLQRQLDILNIIQKRNAERKQEIQDEMMDGFIDESLLENINEKYKNLIQQDINALKNITVTTAADSFTRKETGVSNLNIDKLTDDEINQVLSAEAPINNVGFIGKFISTQLYPFENGNIELEFYEGGVIQKIKLNDGSVIKRLVNLKGESYGDIKGTTISNEDKVTLIEKEFDVNSHFFLTHEDVDNFFNNKIDFAKEVSTYVTKEKPAKDKKSTINIITTPGKDIIQELNKLSTFQEKLNWLKDKKLLTPIKINGKQYNVIDYKDRVMVLIKIGQYNIPFYISTGQAGKKNVKAGNWYVVFGIGSTGWINKGTQNQINSQYNRIVLQKIAQILNEGVGKIETREDGGSGKIKDGVYFLKEKDIDSFNKQMNLPTEPAPSHTSVDAFIKHRDSTLKLLDAEFPKLSDSTPSTQSTKSSTEGKEIKLEEFHFEKSVFLKSTTPTTDENNKTAYDVYDYVHGDVTLGPVIGKYYPEEDIIVLNGGSILSRPSDTPKEDKKVPAFMPALEELRQVLIDLKAGKKVDLYNRLKKYDSDNSLSSIKDYLKELQEAGFLEDVLRNLLFDSEIFNFSEERLEHLANQNVTTQDFIDAVVKHFENYNLQLGVSAESESFALSTEEGEKISTLDSWVNFLEIEPETGNSIFELKRTAEGDPYINNRNFKLAKAGYQVDVDFLREMHKYGNPYEFKVKFKLPTAFPDNQRNITSADDMIILIVVIDNAGKEHIIGELKNQKTSSSDITSYEKTQTYFIRNEILKKYKEAKANNAIPKDYIEASGFALISQIMPGRVNNNNKSKNRRRLSEIWGDLNVKGIAVGLPTGQQGGYNLFHSPLQGANNEKVYVQKSIERTRFDPVNNALFMLAQDSAGRYRWIRVFEVNVGKHKEVKAKVDELLKQMRDISIALAKQGINNKKAFNKALKDKNDLADRWNRASFRLAKEMQSYVRFRKLAPAPGKSKAPYQPNIKPDTIFESANLDDQGFFSPEKFIENNKLYDRPSQIDYEKISNASYAESILDRIEVDLRDGPVFIHPAFRFNGYTSAETKVQDQKEPSPQQPDVPPPTQQPPTTPETPEAPEAPTGKSTKRKRKRKGSQQNKNTNVKNDPIDPNNDDDSLASLFKGIKYSLNEEQAKAELKELIGDFPLEIVDGLIDVGSFKAYGIAKRSLIKLSKFASNKTVYHEAFHIVFRGMLRPDIRRILLDEAKERYNLTEKDLEQAEFTYERLKKKYKNLPESTIEDIALEEKMAEEFAEYRIADTGVTGMLKKFFRVLKNFIKKLRGNWKEIDTLFRKMDRGEFKEGIVSYDFDDAFSMFELTSKEINQSVSTGLALFEKVLIDRYRENPDYLLKVYGSALNSDPEKDLITSTDPEIDSVLNLFLDHYADNPSYKDSIKRIVKALRPDIKDIRIDSDGDVVVDFYSNVNPSKGPLYVEFLKKLSSRGYSIKLDELSIMDSIEEDTSYEQRDIDKDKETAPREAWSFNQAKISPKENMGFIVKRALSLIRKKGEPSFHGMPLYYDHHELYPELQRVVGKASNVREMVDLILKHPVLSGLSPYIRGWDDSGETDFNLLKKNSRANKLVIELFKLSQQKNANTHVLVYIRDSASGKPIPYYIKANRFTMDKFIRNQLNNLYKDGGQSILELPLRDDIKKMLGDPKNSNLLNFLNRSWAVLKSKLANETNNQTKSEKAELNRAYEILTDELSNFYLQDFQDSTFSVEGERMYEWGKPGFLSRFLKGAKNNRLGVQRFYVQDPLYANLPIWEYIHLLKTTTNGGVKYAGEKVGTSYDKMTEADHYNIVLNSWFNNEASIGHISMPIYSDAPVNESLVVPKLNRQEALKHIKALMDFETARINQPEVKTGSSSNFAKNQKSRILIPPQMGETIDDVEKWAINKADEIKEIVNSAAFINLNPNIGSEKELDAFLTDFVLNHLAWQGQMIILTNADPAFYKSKNAGDIIDDFFKRAKELHSPVTYANSNAFWTDREGKVNRVPNKMRIKILPDIETPAPQLETLAKILGKESIKSYEDSVSLTDGQTFVTPHSYKNRMIALQEWSDAKELVWKLLVQGKLPSKANIDGIIESLPEDSPIIDELLSIRSFESIKPYVYTVTLMKILQDNQTSKITPFQKKDSEILILPFYGLKTINGIENPLYNSFYKKLLEDAGYVFNEDGTVNSDAVNLDIDEGVYTFDSTLKAYKPYFPGKPKGYNVEENIDAFLREDVPFVEIDYNVWGKQQETPQHFFESSELFGTQIQKLIMVDLKEDHPRYKEIVTAYQELIIDNIRISYEEVNNEIKDWKDLINLLREDALNSPRAGKDILEMLTLDENGETLVPLWHPAYSKTIESLINSMYRKRVSDQKFSNGYSLINKSAVGFSKKPKLVFKDANGNIIKEGDTKSEPKSLAYIEAILPMTNSEILKYVNEEGFIDNEGFAKMPDSLKESIAYRIPNEFFYSDFKVKAIAFDPFSDTIVLPHEITAIAGLDFDIDKVKGFARPVGERTFEQLAKKTFTGKKILSKYTSRIENIINQINEEEKLSQYQKALLIEKLSQEVVGLSPKEEVDKMRELLQSDEFKNLENTKKALIIELKEIIKERDTELLNDPQVAVETERIQRRRRNERSLFEIMYNDILGDPSVLPKLLKPGGFSTIERLANKYKERNKSGKERLLLLDPITTISIAQRMNQGKALTGIAANANAANALWQHEKNLGLTIPRQVIEIPSNVKDKILSPGLLSDSIISILEASPNKKEILESFNSEHFTSSKAEIVIELHKIYQSIISDNLPIVDTDTLSTIFTSNSNSVFDEPFYTGKNYAEMLVNLYLDDAIKKKNDPSATLTIKEIETALSSIIDGINFSNGKSNLKISQVQSLSQQFDVTGKSKIENIAEFLAAAVDNGKNPLASYINVNTATSDYLFGLLSLGYSIPQAISILNHPEVLKISKLALDYKITISDFLGSNQDNINYELLFDSEGNVLNNGPEIISFLSNIKDEIKDISSLIIQTKIADDGLSATITESYYTINEYDKAFQEISTITGVDSLLYNIEKNYMNTLFDLGVKKSLSDVIQKIGFGNVMGRGFRRILNLCALEKGYRLSKKEVDSLYRQFIEYLGSAHYDYNAFKKSYGSNLDKLKELQKQYPSNPFLYKLEITNKSFIKFNGTIGLDSNEIQKIKDAAAELPEDILNFLKQYSFYSSGYRFTSTGFVQMLPLSSWVDAQEIKTLKENLSFFDKDTFHIELFFDQYIRNNFQELAFITEAEGIFKDAKTNTLFVKPNKRLNPKRIKYLKKYIPEKGNVLFKYFPEYKKYIEVPALSSYENNVKMAQRYFFGEDPNTYFEQRKINPAPTIPPSPPSQGLNNPSPTIPPSKKSDEKTKEGRKDTSLVTFDDLNDEQKEAYSKAYDFFTGKIKGKNFLLRGKAGTGKTTLIKILTQELIKSDNFKRKDKILVLAPTNKAANNLKKAKVEIADQVGVFTISSALGEGYDPVRNLFIPQKEKEDTLLAQVNYIIIDEASMIGEDVFDKIRETNPNAKIIFAGDSGQLAPVRSPEDYISLAIEKKVPLNIVNELRDLSNTINKYPYSNNEIKQNALNRINVIVNQYKLNDIISRPFRSLQETENSSSLTIRVRQGEESSILPWADIAWENSHEKESEKNPYSELQRVDSDELVFVKKEEVPNVSNYAVERFKKAIATKNPNLFKIIVYRNQTVERTNKFIRTKIFGENPELFYEGELIINNNPFKTRDKDGKDYYVTKGTDLQIADKPKKEEIKLAYFLEGLKNELPKNHYFIKKWGDRKFASTSLVVTDGTMEDTRIFILDKKHYAELAEFKKDLFNLKTKLLGNMRAAKQINSAYARLSDTFITVEYSYAINSHQAQGSTYAEGIVSEGDIMSVKMDSPSNLSRSFYTAITRFSERVFVNSPLNGTVNDPVISKPNAGLSKKEQAIKFYTKELPEKNKNVKITADQAYYTKDGSRVMRNTHFRDKPVFQKQPTKVNLNTDVNIDQRMADYSNAIIASKNNPYTDKFGGVKNEFGGSEKIMISINNESEFSEIKNHIDKAFKVGSFNQKATFVFKTVDNLTKAEKKVSDYLISKGVRYYEHDGLGMYIAEDDNFYGNFAKEMGTKIDRFLRDYFNNELKDDLTEYQIVEDSEVEVLNAFIKQLDLFSEYLSSKGETPIALETQFIDTYNNIGTTVDLITIDEQGVRRIYDFKTMRGNHLTDRYGNNVKYETSYSKGDFTKREQHNKQLSTIRIAAFNAEGEVYDKTGYIIPISLNMYSPGDTRITSLKLIGEDFKELKNGKFLITHKLTDEVTNLAGEKITFNPSQVAKKSSTTNITYRERGVIRQFRPLTKVKSPEKVSSLTNNNFNVTEVQDAYNKVIKSLTLEELNNIGGYNFTSKEEAQKRVSEYFKWILEEDDNAYQSLISNQDPNRQKEIAENLAYMYGGNTADIIREFNLYKKIVDSTIKTLQKQPSPKPTTQQQGSVTNNPAEFTNHSGGAYGADTLWDQIGREFGVTDHKHYKDAGNKSLSKKLKDSGVTATVLTKEQMDIARDEVERLTGKKYPDNLQGNLQVRNYYQVVNADSVFAIGELERTVDKSDPTPKDDISKSRYAYPLNKVKGGTNTAVQLGIKMNKPVYVWDVTTKQWHVFNGKQFVPTETPTLTKNFAGVGTRNIESYSVKNKKTDKWEPRKEYLGTEVEKEAKQAIRDVYEKTFTKTQPQTGVKAGVPDIIIKGIEINSKQTGLGNDLTNVHYATNGKSKFDIKPSDSSLTLTSEAKKTWGESVEAWYKSNNAKVKGIPEGAEGDAYDMKLMVGLITDKLRQYPNLVSEITNRGGLQFLEKSTHTMGNSRWSSNNPKNMFMNALKQAYQNVIQPQAGINLGAYVKYNNQIYVVTKIEGNKVKLFNPLLEGSNSNKQVSISNITPVGSNANIVTYFVNGKKNDFFVTKKGVIISVKNGKKMKWGEGSKERNDILELAGIKTPNEYTVLLSKQYGNSTVILKKENTPPFTVIATDQTGVPITDEVTLNKALIDYVKNPNNDASYLEYEYQEGNFIILEDFTTGEIKHIGIDSNNYGESIELDSFFWLSGPADAISFHQGLCGL